MKCNTCDAPFVSFGSRGVTLVAFGSPPGHDHDDNCDTRVYTCAEGHISHLSIIPSCSHPECDWRGKDECFCSVRIDEWPEVVDVPL